MQHRPDPPRRSAGQGDVASRPGGAPPPSPLIAWLRKPQVLLPALVVVGMVVVAFGLQPGTGNTKSADRPTLVALAPATPTGQPSPTTAKSPTVAATQLATATGVTEAVAGVRGTPPASPTPEADLSHETTQCGSIQEQTVPLSVQQVLSGVAVAATRATIYPADYFRCILMATGGREAMALASAVSKAQRDGATHAILVDLWITNAGRDFAQLNLRSAWLAMAGQNFSPLATLGGRSEVVVSSGQGRNLTLVVTVKTGPGATTGPMTLTVEAPMAGGKQTPGKYQLFLPTP